MTNLFPTANPKERAILVHIDFSTFANHNLEEDIIEFQELVSSAGADTLHIVTAKRTMPDIKYFIGSGKVEEIKTQIQLYQANLVIFNHDLTPAQERNLEKFLGVRVIDRAQLILDIFAQRALSFEGKLQVELAQLEHLSTRLIRGWTHLERQKGGIGLRGPGETQLETDRRLVRKRIMVVKSRLEKVRTDRAALRRARQRSQIPVITLVGYTNAGKSTLFNRLTNANAYVANKLFATLDPTLRGLELPNFGKIIFTDTVGFIRHLPHQLIDAFRATLEETLGATLLLHVVDAHDPQHQEKILAVKKVLAEIGAEKIPMLEVFNKIDLLSSNETTPKLEIAYDENKKPKRVFVSAQNNLGINSLLEAIKELLKQDFVNCKIILDPNESRLRALLYKKNAVLSEKIDKKGRFHLALSLAKDEYMAMKKNLK